jgi:hypothetical protein
MVNDAGLKAKFWIVTECVAGAGVELGCGAGGVELGWGTAGVELGWAAAGVVLGC